MLCCHSPAAARGAWVSETGLPVAVIGGGPVGLAAAVHLYNVAWSRSCWRRAPL